MTDLNSFIEKVNLLLDLGRYSDLMTLSKKQLELNPNDPIPLFYVGLSFEELAETNKAIKVYLQVLELDANFEQAHHRLALLLQFEFEDRAKGYIDAALKIAPNDPEILATAAVLYHTNFDFKTKPFWKSKGEKLLIRAKSIASTNDYVKAIEADFAFKELNFKKLKKKLEENINPNSDSGIGMINLSKGRYKEAEENFMQAYAKTSDDDFIRNTTIARLGKYFPFNYLIKNVWFTYLVSFNLQIFALFGFGFLSLVFFFEFETIGSYFLKLFGVTLFVLFSIQGVLFLWAQKNIFKHIPFFNISNLLRVWCILFSSVYLYCAFRGFNDHYYLTLNTIIPLGYLGYLHKEEVNKLHKVIGFVVFGAITASYLYLVAVDCFGIERQKIFTMPFIMSFFVCMAHVVLIDELRKNSIPS